MNQKTSKSGNEITRRTFIKTAGAATLSFGLMSSFTTNIIAAPSRKIMGAIRDYYTLDPTAHMGIGHAELQINVYDSLYRYEGDPPVSKPWLSKNYKVSPDGLKWDFYLREGVKFHNDDEVTASDVKYCMDRLLRLGIGQAGMFKGLVQSTEVLNRYTVRFNLSTRDATFFARIPRLYIMNSKLLKENEVDGDWGSKWAAINDAGSGSYKIEEFSPSEGFVMSRFKDHFLGWGNQHVDVVQWTIVKEQASAFLGFERGDYHIGGRHFTYDQFKKLAKSRNVQVLQGNAMRQLWADMMTEREPLNDVHVRRAINYSFPYEGYINEIAKGQVARTYGPVPPGIPGALEEPVYKYDTQKALHELDKAKVNLDRTLEIGMLSPGEEAHKPAAQLIQDSLRQIGLKATIVPKPLVAFVKLTKKRETTLDFMQAYHSMYMPDAYTWLRSYQSTRPPAWYRASWYKNLKVDQLIDEALKQGGNPARQGELYREANKIIVDEAPSLWMGSSKAFAVASKKLKNVRFCPVVKHFWEARWWHFG